MKEQAIRIVHFIQVKRSEALRKYRKCKHQSTSLLFHTSLAIVYIDTLVTTSSTKDTFLMFMSSIMTWNWDWTLRCKVTRRSTLYFNCFFSSLTVSLSSSSTVAAFTWHGDDITDALSFVLPSESGFSTFIFYVSGRQW